MPRRAHVANFCQPLVASQITSTPTKFDLAQQRRALVLAASRIGTSAWCGRSVRRLLSIQFLPRKVKLLGISVKATGVARCPTNVDADVATIGPAQLLQPLQERRETRLSFRIVGGEVHEDADLPHLTGLLRARRERPGGRAAEQ